MQRKSIKINKTVCLGCAAGTLAATASILFGAAVCAGTNRCLDESDLLKTDGRLIKNTRGETVTLRGICLGGWLPQDSQICLSNREEPLCGSFDTLAERFGNEKAGELINTYLDNWITAHDLDRLMNLGVNCLRIPFNTRNLHGDGNGTRRRNKDSGIDFSRLDWIVSECGKRGIYVILDIQNALGFHSDDRTCGRAETTELFDCSLTGLKYRQRTAETWQAIARHFRGNPAVAAFDLLNRSVNSCSVNDQNDKHHWRLYNKLYKAVRSEDPSRMIIIPAVCEPENAYGARCSHRNVIYQPDIDNRAIPEIDRLISDISAGTNGDIPLMFCGNHADGSLDFILSAFNKNSINWCAGTYKGFEAQKSGLYLFTADTGLVNLQEDSFEQIKVKWGKQYRTAESFSENKELYAMLKKYLTGYFEPGTETPADKASSMSVEVYSADENIPKTDESGPTEPVKFVFGTVTLAGIGTLAELTKKSEGQP